MLFKLSTDIFLGSKIVNSFGWCYACSTKLSLTFPVLPPVCLDGELYNVEAVVQIDVIRLEPDRVSDQGQAAFKNFL